jgi:undecaprenyl-diphosphatase
MTVALVILLAVVQGLTEFLPVSSSGHLKLLESAFGIQEPQTAFDVVLHVGTLTAVLLVYRREVGAILASLGRSATRLVSGRRRGLLAEEPDTRLALLILLGSLPAGLVGVLLGDVLEGHLASPLSVGIMLLVTAAFLLFGDRSRVGRGAIEGRPLHALTVRDALVIGTVQGFAILRGISRSGSTIATALLVGVRRDDAARFSFLLSIPAIVGAAALHLRHLTGDGLGAGLLLLGGVVAAFVGWIALLALIRVVRAGRLELFAWYCGLVGAAAIVASLAGWF